MITRNFLGRQVLQPDNRKSSSVRSEDLTTLEIQDDKEKINLELLSRKFRVKPINEMVVKFRKIKDVAIEVVA